MKKEIKDMTSEEIKKDFEGLIKKNEVGVLLEYLYTSVATCGNGEIRDIAQYYRQVKNLADDVTDFLYIISNENLKTLFQKIDVKDKRIATVGSSGDQALNAIYHGAKQVDLIDANFLTKPYVELKIAAIKGLEFNEFISWIENLNEVEWYDPNEERMKSKMFCYFYSKFSNKLPADIQMFWDFIICDNKLIEEVGKFFHFNNADICEVAEFYETQQGYEKMRAILNEGNHKIDYIISEFSDFPKKLNGKYDYILLSNIENYCYGFKDVANKLYKCNLNKGGMIQLNTCCHVYNRCRLATELSSQNHAEYVELEDTGMCGDKSVFMKKPFNERDKIDDVREVNK